MLHSPREPDFLHNLRSELSNGRLWFDRAVVVLVHAMAAGLSVVGFTLPGEWGFRRYERLYGADRWAILRWAPALIATIVWVTRRHFAGAAGSCISQIMATLEPALPPAARSRRCRSRRA